MMAVKALTGFVTWLIVPELWLSHHIIWVKSPGLLTGLKFLSVSDLAMIAQHTSKNLWNCRGSLSRSVGRRVAFIVSPMMTARIILITQCINCNPNGPRFIFRETDKPKGYQLTEMLFPLIIKRAINRSFYISVRFDREVFNHREF